MDATKAQETLLEQVYAPAFIKACADRGIQFQNDADLTSALETVGLLKLAEAQAAAEAGTPVQNASALLKQAMFGESQQNQPNETAEKVASLNPKVAEAALTLLSTAVGGNQA